MKIVPCQECKKEIKFTDAAPSWDLSHPGPPIGFLCKECMAKYPIASDEELCEIMDKSFVKYMRSM